MSRLPGPAPKYDAENEAQTRSTIERELERLTQELRQAIERIKKTEDRLTAGGL